jgi:hypothetical protein
VDLIPKIYDSERSIRILGTDGAEQYARINTIGPDGQALNDLTRGKYDVQVQVGPNFGTKRQEAAEIYMGLSQGNPQVMGVAGDLIFKALDLPYSDDMAERMKTMLPPQVQQMLAAKDKQGGKALPPEAQMAMAQADQAMALVQQQSQLVQAAAAEVETNQAEAEKAAAGLEVQAAKMQADYQRMLADIAKKEAGLVLKEAQLSRRRRAMRRRRARLGRKSRPSGRTSAQWSLSPPRSYRRRFRSSCRRRRRPSCRFRRRRRRLRLLSPRARRTSRLFGMLMARWWAAANQRKSASSVRRAADSIPR